MYITSGMLVLLVYGRAFAYGSANVIVTPTDARTRFYFFLVIRHTSAEVNGMLLR